MADSIRITRRRADADAVEANSAMLRMALVVAASLAILVSLPGWLRSLEQRPAPLAPFQHASPPLVLDPPAAAQPVGNAATVSKETARYQSLAETLAKRYRVSKDAVERFIALAYSAGQMTKVDPLLILAVMAVESSFNPIAESVMGAKGLMQIIPEYHQDKLRSAHGGQMNVLDPEINILAGAKVLREYASRTGNDLAAALRLYGGTGPDPANSYSHKVLSERERLEQLLRRSPERASPPPLPTGPSI